MAVEYTLGDPQTCDIYIHDAPCLPNWAEDILGKRIETSDAVYWVYFESLTGFPENVTKVTILLFKNRKKDKNFF